MRVAVIGQGSVGLTAAVCLARQRHEVAGSDADPARLEPLGHGFPPCCEPGLLYSDIEARWPPSRCPGS